jgi:hypothetical protein
MEEMHSKTSNLMGQMGHSSNGSKSKQISGTNEPKSRISRSRRSDSIADGGQNLKEVELRLKAEKEEMRLKVDKELLKYMLTGIMPQHAQVY